MIKRRDFLKKSGMIAMAAAFPGIINAEVETTEESAVLNKNKIKVNNQWDVIAWAFLHFLMYNPENIL